MKMHLKTKTLRSLHNNMKSEIGNLKLAGLREQEACVSMTARSARSKAIITVLALVVASMLSSQQVFAQKTGFVVDEIVAKVDNYIVLKSEVDRMYQDYLTNGNSPSQRARCEILALITRNKLMLAKAEIDSVVVLDAEVDANTQRRMDIILAQSGKTPLELEEIYGKTLEQIRSELRDQIREQMIVQKMEE